MTIEFLDPTHEHAADAFIRAPRLRTLAQQTIVIVSNGKKNTVPFFDAFERTLRERYAVADVVRITKGNYSTPVETELLGDAERWNALIAGIGD